MTVGRAEDRDPDPDRKSLLLRFDSVRNADRNPDRKTPLLRFDVRNAALAVAFPSARGGPGRRSLAARSLAGAPLVAVGLLVAGISSAAGCSKSAPTSSRASAPAPVRPKPASVQPGASEPEPTPSGPVLRAERVAGDGRPAWTRPGPDLPEAGHEIAPGDEPAAPWDLPDSPGALVWRHLSVAELDVELLDARGRAWPTRVRYGAVDGRTEARVELGEPLPANRLFRLVVKAPDASWEQPLRVASP